jgi:hypothetical protein
MECYYQWSGKSKEYMAVGLELETKESDDLYSGYLIMNY